jgi:hypothetical protein
MCGRPLLLRGQWVSAPIEVVEVERRQAEACPEACGDRCFAGRDRSHDRDSVHSSSMPQGHGCRPIPYSYEDRARTRRRGPEAPSHDDCIPLTSLIVQSIARPHPDARKGPGGPFARLLLTDYLTIVTVDVLWMKTLLLQRPGSGWLLLTDYEGAPGSIPGRGAPARGSGCRWPVTIGKAARHFGRAKDPKTPSHDCTSLTSPRSRLPTQGVQGATWVRPRRLPRPRPAAATRDQR